MEANDEGVEVNYIPPSAIEEIVLQTKDDENALFSKQLANEDLSPVLLVFRLVEDRSESDIYTNSITLKSNNKLLMLL
jgi:hypothetical protein